MISVHRAAGMGIVDHLRLFTRKAHRATTLLASGKDAWAADIRRSWRRDLHTLLTLLTLFTLTNVNLQIALFDVKRGSLRSFNVNLDPQPAVTPTDHAMRRHTEVSLLVDCDGGIVDIFRDGGSNPLREWSHARYSMTGQQITTSSLQSPPRQEPPPASWKIVGPFQAHSFMPRPSGYQGLFNNGSVLFWPGHHSHDVDAHSRDGRPWRKCFDLRKAQLRKQYVLGMSEADKNDYDTSTGVQAWKDISLQTRGLVGDEVGNEEGRFGALVTRTITDDM